MNKHRLLSIDISHCSYDTFLEAVMRLPESKESSYVCFANVHMLVECHRNAAYRKMINSADLVAPDGKPVAALLGVSAGARQDKISGPDLFEDLLAACASRNKSIFFYGSTPELLRKLIERISTHFPELVIKGSYSPPFRELSAAEKTDIADTINATEPDFVFVALGCPKQEKWMAQNAGKIKGCMLGFGQAFQIHAGTLRRAPVWMQQAGLEWAFRFWMEPRRLWRRYVYTNSYFVFLILRDIVSDPVSKLLSRKLN